MAQAGDIINGVLVGKEGWLYLHDGDHNEMAHLRGDMRPTDASIAHFAANIRSRRALCRRAGIPYAHVVFPSKAVIETSMLPDGYADSINSLFQTSYWPALDEDARGAVHYPDTALKTVSGGAPAFQKADTHMNFFGIRKVVEKVLRGFGVTQTLDGVLVSYEREMTGDLALMLGDQGKRPELFPALKDMYIHRFDNLGFLRSNTNNIYILHNDMALTEKRILLVGDSFLKHSVYLFIGLFRDVMYVRSPNFQPDAMTLFGPDYVISANTERYLSVVSDDADATSVIFGPYGRSDYAPSQPFSDALRAQLSWTTMPRVYQNWVQALPRPN